MGRLFQLFGMEKSDEFDTMLPKKRQDEIAKIHDGTTLVGIYSPETFTVSFRGEIVAIKEGWHEYAPAFGVWALQKYGKGSRYGQTYRTVDGKMIANPELLDENPAGDEAPQRRTRTKAEAE